jgi:hypothetical protein
MVIEDYQGYAGWEKEYPRFIRHREPEKGTGQRNEHVPPEKIRKYLPLCKIL